MNIWKKLKAAWYSFPAELLRGVLRGQLIRFTDPNRYRELKDILPDSASLVNQKNQIVRLFKDKLISNKIGFINVYGRVKTLGSLDRKERYARIMYPENAKDFTQEDLIGITLLVESPENCYKVFGLLETIGVFPKLHYRPNPRDYITEAEKVRRPEVISVKDAIIGNMLVRGFNQPIHVRVMTKAAHFDEILDRGAYKNRIKKTIEGKQFTHYK